MGAPPISVIDREWFNRLGSERVVSHRWWFEAVSSLGRGRRVSVRTATSERRPVGSVLHTDARTGMAAELAAAEAASAPDCRNCGFRSRCITYGWVSPGGLWFENAVVLRPKPGCRGYVGRGADILDHFGEPYPERTTRVEPAS